MPLNTVQASMTTGVLKTANSLSEIPEKDEQTVPLGSITLCTASVIPKGWLLCDGSLISKTTYAALYAVVGNAFGEASNTFGVPLIANLKGDARLRYIIKATRFTP